MSEKLNRLGVTKNRISIIPNFVDNCFFEVSCNNTLSNTILYIGSLKRVKGVDVLIKAFSSLNHNFKDLNLTIVGDGEERKRLKEMIHVQGLDSVVKDLVYVPYHLVKNQLSNALVFVLPSRSEGLPNVLLQAMAVGLPIVATQVGGVPSLIKNGENGLLVPADNPEELYNAIKRILQDHHLAKKLRVNSRRTAEEYRVEKIVNSYEELFRYIVD